MFSVCLPIYKGIGKHENSGDREYTPWLQTKTKLADLI